MRKPLSTLLFFFFTCCCTTALHADDPAPSKESGFKNRVELNSSYFFASDAITNRFAKDYYLGHFIDTKTKDGVSGYLSGLSRLGAGSDISLSYERKPEKLFGLNDAFWYLDINSRNEIISTFRKDLFELYFRGNKMFAGKTADLSDFRFENSVYQQVVLGIGKSTACSKGELTWSAGLAFNKGQRYLSIEAPGASLYTAPDGYFLDVELELEIRQSDSARKSLSAVNGLGSSLMAAVEYKDERDNIFKFELENAGFITWNKESSFVPADSSFQFIGVDANDLFNFTDTVQGTLTSDSAYVQGFLTKRRKESFTTPLPVLIQATYFANLAPDVFGIEIGASYLGFASSFPRAWGKACWTFHPHHQLSLKASYGGYTVWNLGLGYSALLGKSFVFSLQSDYLSAMLRSTKGRAQGAFVSLSKYF